MISGSLPMEQSETTSISAPEISSDLISEVCQRLAQDRPVRRTLPEGGRLHIDRQLPFLCVYRQPLDLGDAGTERLVKGEASYLVTPGGAPLSAGLADLVRGVVKTLAARFEAFLIVEIWADRDGGKANDAAIPTVSPRFTIYAPARGLTRSVEVLERYLARIRILKQPVEVAVRRNDLGQRPDAEPWLTEAEAAALNCSFVGIVVPPVYRKAGSTKEYPLLVNALRRSLSLALRHTYYAFACSNTTLHPSHYHSLGRRAVVKAVWRIDEQLAEVDRRFSYLQLLTPVNAKSAWRRFQRDDFARPPVFHYRPCPIDPDLVKRDLYKIPIERVEDPALQQLFREKQHELELQLTMLRDRDTPRFVHESLQLFGGVQDDLLQRAEALLQLLQAHEDAEREGGDNGGDKVDALAFARRAEAEFESYRRAFGAFTATTEVNDETNGLVVSKGRLFIGADLSLAPSRVEALLAHEVGTHVVTYFNGYAQPFQQLRAGLAGYEELQEGLAVLSEYLVGGLSRSRMQLIAARVVAVRHLIDGASFIDTFRALAGDHGLTKARAYNVAMRVYRGGGFTKDAVYLRGLEQVLRHLRGGGELEPLYVGKIAIAHLPILKELRLRNVLVPTPIVPRHLSDPRARARLEFLRSPDRSVVDLICSPDGEAVGP